MTCQIMYGVTGVRRLEEVELPWLPCYEQSVPVRIGNAAVGQFQLDVYGEVMDVLHLARAADLQPHESAWRVQLSMLSFLSSRWKEPDEGIWEVRGAAAFHTLQGDGLGRLRPRNQGCGGLQASSLSDLAALDGR